MFSTLKKINFLITNRQRKGLLILTFLLFVGMILEVFGLGILIPALSILLEPDMIEKTQVISSITSFFPDFSHQNFVVFFLAVILLLYIIKTLFIIFLTYKQNKFLNNLVASISNKLFLGYLSQPYIFHLNRNASELIKNTQAEIFYLYTFLLSLITVFIEGGFIISVLATLLYLEPVGALSIGIFYGFLSILFLKFTKSKLKKWGQLRESIDAKISKVTLEGLGGIKDLLILGKTNYYEDEFSNSNYFKAKLNTFQATLSQIPRFYLELISIFGLISFIMLLLLQGRDTTSLFTTLGVFVAATFRMIPSLNRILGSSQQLKYCLPSVDTIYNEITMFIEVIDPINLNRNFKFQSEIYFNKVTYCYTRGDIILKSIDFKIKKGQIVGVIGESGSGKSTFVDLLIGLNKPTSGEIVIDGVSGFQLNQSWRNNIGYVSQSIYLTDDSIEANIAFAIPKSKINKGRIREVLKQVQLEKFINKLEFGVETKVGERGVQLSGGQRQRIGIARALYHDPDILILDEATSALDQQTEIDLMKSIDNLKKDKTIVIIAHRLSTIKNCDLVYEIKDNKMNLNQST